MSTAAIGFLIPEFPQQTHIAWWRVSEGMRESGVDVTMLSTRRPREPCPHPELVQSASRTLYLWPPSAGDLAAFLVNGRKTLGAVRYLVGLRAVRGLGRVRNVALLLAAQRLCRIARARGLRHVFVHSCGDAAHVVALAHILDGLSYTLRLGGDLEVYGGDHQSKMRCATLIVPAARAYESRLISEVGVPADRVMWSMVGTDTDAFRPVARNRASKQLQLVTVARLNLAKGFQYLIPALRQLADTGIDFRYRVAGAGPFREEIERLIARHLLGDRVELLGSQSVEQIATVLSESDIFILPTSGIGEGTPAAICEAMSAGLPVVATNVGGVADMIEHETHGLLVEPADSGALARALRRLAHDPDLTAAMGKAARDRAVREFDYRATARRILDRITALDGLESGVARSQPARASVGNQ